MSAIFATGTNQSVVKLSESSLKWTVDFTDNQSNPALPMDNPNLILKKDGAVYETRTGSSSVGSYVENYDGLPAGQYQGFAEFTIPGGLL